MKNKIKLYAFIEGGLVMLLEITAALIAAPVLGASMRIWTLLICLSVLALAIGYFAGGKISISNKKKEWDKINLLFAICSIIISLGLIFSFFINYTNSFGNYYFSTYLIIILTLFIPLIILGATTPLLTSVYSGRGNVAGKASGSIYATSTIGGIAFALFTGFYLLPELGVQRTLIVGLTIISLVIIKSFASKKKYVIPVIVTIGVLINIFLTYHYSSKKLNSSFIKVIDYEEGIMGQLLVADITRKDDPSITERILFINRMGQTWINKTTGYSTWSYPNYITSLASIYPAKSQGLVLGLGGGIIAKQLAEINGFYVDGVELDERIINIAKKYFQLNSNLVKIYNDDARHFIRRSKKKYDFIVFDLFNGEITPSHSLSTETFEETAKILNPDGMLVINFNGFIEGPDGLATRSIYKTLLEAGFKVELFPTNEKEIVTRNILLIAYLDSVNLSKTIIKVNTDEGEYLIHEHLLDKSTIDLSNAIVITDDKPILEWINQASAQKWRDGYYKNFTLKLKETSGIPLYK